MNKLLLSGLVFASAAVSYSQVTVAVSSSAGAGGLGQFSNNTSWNTVGGFTFAVGVFDVGFTPTSQNVSSWADAWNVAVGDGFNTGTGTWLDDGGSTYFSLSGAYTTNTAPFTQGARMYVWGYDTQALASGAEWILLTNPNWLVSNTASPSTAFFDTTDVGTVAVVGSISNAGVDLKSAAVGSPIPEPSTAAAIGGLIALGAVATRRRRAA